ncbi:hypothetical protein Cni_G02512 [Canna indica]|uniref:Remorin C-terminal domain-containing protein n=1 Tax=Canna indica TaxID=4628 RepID=A0AAQ3JQ87_9LILI|nr:hypothetical protein Cni_G02512 [Canna indica]
MATSKTNRRVRFNDLGEDYQGKKYNTREGRKGEKRVSSNEERKKTQNWFQRQLSGQMNDVNDTSDIMFATAAAAAAYAITLLEEEEESFKQNKRIEPLAQPTAKTKSKREDTMNKPTDYSRLSRKVTGKEQKEEERRSVSGGSSVKTPQELEGKMMGESAIGHTLSGKAKKVNHSIKKTPTFSDKYLNDTASSNPEQGQNQKYQRTPSMTKPNGSRRTDSSTKVETKVDAWERAKMNKIRERHEKMKSTILEWENEKKSKAKRGLERKEGYLELKRARTRQECHSELSRIDKIASGARALAEERRRKDESKIAEKAKKMRSTGRDPEIRSCF